MNHSIDLDLCKNCGLCLEVCPCNIIGKNEKDEISFLKNKESICLHCAQCMAICPTKAISINGLSYENDLVDLPVNHMNYNVFTDFLANRRSIRNFKDKPIPNEVISKILKSIDFAPYGAEPEKINITVVNNRATIETALPYISKFLDNIVKWVDNPLASFIIKRKKGTETFNTIKKHLYPISKSGNYNIEFGDRITRGAPALIIFHAEKEAAAHTNNSLIYATYSILTAHALGLGATMIEIVPAAINKVPKVKEIFKIPEKNEAVMSVIIGYPRYKYQRAIIRKNENIEWVE